MESRLTRRGIRDAGGATRADDVAAAHRHAVGLRRLCPCASRSAQDLIGCDRAAARSARRI